MAAITKKSTIGEVLNMNIETASFLYGNLARHCLGRPASQGESIEEACMVHGTNADELVAKLNAFLAQKSSRVRRFSSWTPFAGSAFLEFYMEKYDFDTAAGLYGGSGAAECLDWRYIGTDHGKAADLTAAGWAYCIGYRLGYPFGTAGACGAQCAKEHNVIPVSAACAGTGGRAGGGVRHRNDRRHGRPDHRRDFDCRTVDRPR